MKTLQERTGEHHHHHHACDLKDPAQLAEFRARVVKLGWTFKARFIDHDTNCPLIGVRLTNCAALFESARSIQILNKSEVMVQTGFTNDETVSLTADDGREFLLWMKHAKPDLIAPIWHALPEANDADQKEQAGPVIDLDKNTLVIYLASAYPELFGPNGIVSVTGASFHAELLRLIKDPVRDDLKRFDLVQAIENMAHDFYADAAAHLRAAKETADAKKQQLHANTAAGMVIAAESARERANVIRQRMETPPPVQPFPEAIVWDEQRIDTPERAGEPATADNIAPGDVVGVTDPQSAYFKQMGRVIIMNPTGPTLTISGQSHPIQFTFDQLMKLA